MKLLPSHQVTGLKESGSGAVAAGAVSYAGSTGLAAADVEAALDELDTEKAPVGHTHPASSGRALIQLSSTVAGEPVHVWTDDDQPLMVEVAL